ncbi:hypothetical protein [Streptomyces sp. NBC_00690]|uniref:hypothetical protein n=1 Tax=Streptomyces sp. NBC_00690 TaxID=2975808 RepID=UPI002E29C52D|nr:hypothetical protein [Streptomyces sp. NBC_00690]
MTAPRTLSEILRDRLLAHPRKRIPFDDLADAAYAANPALLTDPERRHAFADNLRALQDAGALKLPVTRKFWDHTALPALPQWAERIDPLRPAVSRPPVRSWVAELSFLDGRRLSPHDHRLFTRLNDFLLADGATSELIPLRDRSFELFGEEKHLDGIHESKWVLGGFLSIGDHLRAYLTPEPLNIIELGPAPWLLIVENTATFDNLRRILRKWPHPDEVGWIAFGDGDRVASSITTLPERLAETGHPLTEILYYGDLDYDGLHCVTLTSQRSTSVGLPPLTPASGLYAELITCTRRYTDAVAPETARGVSAWLPAPLASHTADALTSGAVVRQEALCLTTLRKILAPAHGNLRQQLAVARAV